MSTVWGGNEQRKLGNFDLYDSYEESCKVHGLMVKAEKRKARRDRWVANAIGVVATILAVGFVYFWMYVAGW